MIQQNWEIEDLFEYIAILKSEAFKVGEAQALEWVEKEVIGKDKDYSDGDKFERNFGEARNELRARQRQLIKQRKDL